MSVPSFQLQPVPPTSSCLNVPSFLCFVCNHHLATLLKKLPTLPAQLHTNYSRKFLIFASIIFTNHYHINRVICMPYRTKATGAKRKHTVMGLYPATMPKTSPAKQACKPKPLISTASAKMLTGVTCMH